MEINMKVSSRKTFMMGKELTFGKMEPFTKENTKKERSMDLEFCIATAKKKLFAG
jgi:hypothetical protein